MKIVGIVPIKLNNERLPGKNIKLLGGRPLIQYILSSLSESDKLDEIYVYCSNESIKDYFIDSNKIKFLQRPKYLDEPTSNFTQIFDSFSKEIDADIYVFAHATAPFVSTETIDECISNVMDNGYDSSFTAEKIQDFMWKDNKPMNFDASDLPRSQDLQPIYRETSGVYVFTKDVFNKYKRRIGENPYPVEVSFKESIDINYPKDFEMAELFYGVNNNVFNNISLLDCTLRDGGCVNSFDFGSEDMYAIKSALENTGVETIELGYINKKGFEFSKTQFVDDNAVNKFLNNKKDSVNYVVMIDYGTFDFESLSNRSSNSIDGIRLAFHKKDRYEAIKCAEILENKGYDVYIQPMVVVSYTEDELLELIDLVNSRIPSAKAFYIVDSFGQMQPNDVKKLLNIVDVNLAKGIKIGFHGHNNMQMAYANSIEFVKTNSIHEKMIDCSLMGMGKGAGNLPTELISSYLNNNFSKSYNASEIYNVIDKIIKKYSERFKWGYCPEFFLSAKYGCTPSFVNYFINNYNVSLEDLDELLSMLDDDKKIASNKEHGDVIYKLCMEKRK